MLRTQLRALHVLISQLSFTNILSDLHVLCGTDGYGFVSLHRAVLALHSPFLAELMADKDEAFLILPDVSKDDFMDLVKLLYCDKTDSQVKLIHFVGIQS